MKERDFAFCKCSINEEREESNARGTYEKKNKPSVDYNIVAVNKYKISESIYPSVLHTRTSISSFSRRPSLEKCSWPVRDRYICKVDVG